MKIRAAVLEEFAKPLVVQELELAEPGPGEVLVRLVACGVCHTDMYTASGADPSGYAPTVLGHEGAGVVERCRRRRRRSCVTGDHVVTLFSPQCGECVHCRSPLTNLCLAIREQQNQGYLPDGTTRLSRDGEPLRHFMGTSHVRGVHGDAGDRAARRSPRRRRWTAPALFACGLSTGLGAAINTAKVTAGSTCVVFGAGHGRARGGRRLPPAGRRADRLRRPLARAAGARARPGRHRPAGRRARTRSQRILEMTGGFGADYTFEATGSVAVMRQAVEAARMGWGLCTVCGVAGRGETLDIVPRLPDHRPAHMRLILRRREGTRPGARSSWSSTSTGEIDVDPFISHRLRLDEINRGFELMEAQDGIRSVIEL